MKAFRRIFQRTPGGGEGVQVVETEVPKEERLGIEPIYIKSMTLESSEDLKKVGDELRSGNIVILNITSFMSRDVEGLKQAIAQLKGMCYAIGGDIGRLGDSWIVATPKYVTIQFREQGTGPVT